MPSSTEKWLAVSEKFQSLWNFPHCFGAMDGKHIMIQAPVHSGSDFFNYKSFFSIVLFALVDAEYNFIFVDVGCQGRISDGGVFKNTGLFKKLEEKTLNLPPPKPLPGSQTKIPFVIVADKAFQLTDNIMKPFSGVYFKGSKERIFNYRLSRSRRVVENVFGIVSSIFRVLRKPLLLKPKTAGLVVLTTVYLHNFLRQSKSSSNIYIPPQTLDSENEGQLVEGNWRKSLNELTSLLPIKNIARRSSAIAKSIREEFSNYFISNRSVPWQFNG